MLRWATLSLALASLVQLGCGKGETPDSLASAPATDATDGASATGPLNEQYPIIRLTTEFGPIVLRLDAVQAPATVNNFLRYVNSGQYDGTIFHHVQPGSMVLGGGFTPDLQPIATRRPIRNEAYNGRKNERGTVAMLRDPDSVDSATCQFFINLAENDGFNHLDIANSQSYGYCVFGEVIEGMETVEKIAALRRHDEGDFLSTPVERVVIRKAQAAVIYCCS